MTSGRQETYTLEVPFIYKNLFSNLTPRHGKKFHMGKAAITIRNLLKYLHSGLVEVASLILGGLCNEFKTQIWSDVSLRNARSL